MKITIYTFTSDTDSGLVTECSGTPAELKSRAEII